MTDTMSPSDQRPATPIVLARNTARIHAARSENIAHLSQQLQAIVLRQQNKSALLTALFELQLQRTTNVGCATLVHGPNNAVNMGPHRFPQRKLDDEETHAWLVREFQQLNSSGGLRVARSTTQAQLAAIIVPFRVDEHAAWVTLVNLPEGDPRLPTEIAITQLVVAYASK